MIDNQLEDKLKENAEAIFGKGKEPPAGHRVRFEQRLKAIKMEHEKGTVLSKKRTKGAVSASNKVFSLKTWIITSVASVAILIGFVFLLNLYTAKSQETELSIVRGYYHLLLEEKVFTTCQLIQQVDESYRETLFSNVAFIENEPAPEAQLPDDELIKLITCFYSKKIETLENLQNIILSIKSVNNN